VIDHLLLLIKVLNVRLPEKYELTYVGNGSPGQQYKGQVASPSPPCFSQLESHQLPF
jgi:hypothetical protein